MPKPNTTVEVQTSQKVNNPDGTQTEITVKERRLKKAHDKQMARLQSRQRRAASEVLSPENDTDGSDESSSDGPSVAAQTVLDEKNSSEMPAVLAKASKADRRKKPEPSAPAPETESPAADSESGDPAAE